MTSSRHTPPPSYWQMRYDEQVECNARLRKWVGQVERERDKYRCALWLVSWGCVLAFVVSGILALGRM